MATSEEAKPNPMVKPTIPKVLMGRGGYLSNEERIKKDEAELEEMKKLTDFFNDVSIPVMVKACREGGKVIEGYTNQELNYIQKQIKY